MNTTSREDKAAAEAFNEEFDRVMLFGPCPFTDYLGYRTHVRRASRSAEYARIVVLNRLALSAEAA